ncbi:hypothetical protein [Komagataeibacter oboediens]|nr:hypothetical protein [Komagataeibacter oboediens]
MRGIFLTNLCFACIVFLLAQPVWAENRLASICMIVGYGILVNMGGLYGEHLHSVLRNAMLRGAACLSDVAELHAFSLVTDPVPHPRVFATRFIGLGRLWSKSVERIGHGGSVIA